MEKSIRIMLLQVAFGLLVSCESFVDIGPSPQMMESKDVFISRQTAESAVDGVYAFMRTSSPSLLNGALSIYCGLAADELHVSAESDLYSPFYRNALQADNSVVSYQLWDVPYQTIYRCNAILEQLEVDGPLRNEELRTLVGEMKLVRALHYMYLVGLFGETPLVLTTDYEKNTVLGRATVNEVRQQVISDLQQASEILPDQYRGTGKIRPNKWAAMALLARAYLYVGDYPNAGAAASAVLDADAYELVSDMHGIFTIGSAETIWEIAPPNETGNTAEAGAFLPPTGGISPSVLPVGSMLADYDAHDRRLGWFGRHEARGEPETYIEKYRYLPYDGSMEFLVVSRLAEQYLIRAESRIHAGDLEGAREDINRIRIRAGLDSLSTANGELLMETLREERKKELLAEWGHRWFDLNRWGIADEILGVAKPGWKPAATLFPIPYEQLVYNPNLTQNPGY